MDAKFKSGNPIMVDYTPGSAVDAGDVVVVGANPVVAHNNIASGELGAMATRGGQYKMTAATSAAAGTKVYWVTASSKVSSSSNSGANKHFGYIALDSSAAADGDEVLVLHEPAN